MSEHEGLLEEIFGAVREDFSANRRIMSFGQFHDAFMEHPRRHGRNAAQYLRDCFAHFGAETSQGVAGEVTRWAVFDGERERMVGQERAQTQVVRLIENFVRSGRIDKLILLHGPNGSAKSTFVKKVLQALEAYSASDEGALYRFNWVFPSERLARGQSIGFGSVVGARGARTAEHGPAADLDTFAFLDEEQIDAKLMGTLRDHPLLLLPQRHRERLLDAALPGARRAGEEVEADFVWSEYICRGDLSHTNRQIFDALLTAYRGDLARVLKHVQIERFYISRRYRRGAVTVEPQLRVDAQLRQLTADRSLGALPPSLQNQALFEPAGDLVDANRGVIEYDDLFKRHPDLNKYLLAASERGAVSLDDRILFLDLVLLGTCNETYLDAFKQTPDYASFKGRVELVRLPYLLDYEAEEQIYAAHLEHVRLGKSVAPHTTRVAALWAVLTRLNRPNPEAFPELLREVIGKLTPLEKADLYARGKTPDHLSQEQGRALRQQVGGLLADGASSPAYEGRFGASAREIKIILLNASQNEAFPCLSPLAVFAELEELIKDPTVFPFLQLKPDEGYREPGAFIKAARGRYLDLIDREIQDALGLVEEEQYEALFKRYIEHVSQWIKGEQVYNSITGRSEPPDEKLMGELELTMGIIDAAHASETDARRVRGDLITSIAAYTIEHPGEAVDFKIIFPTYFEALRRSFFRDRQRQIERAQRQLLQVFEGEGGDLSAQELAEAEGALERLRSRYGYTDESAREAVAFLLSNRYRTVEE